MYPKTESQDATARFSTPEAGQREEAHHFFEVNGSPSSSKKRVQLELDSDDEVELRASPSKKQHKAKEEDDGDWTPGRGDEPRQRPAGEQAYMKRNVPPSGVQGRRVIWDRQIKTINTTKAKKLYKMFNYSEHQVQQAAYNMRRGQHAFKNYLQGLYDRTVEKSSRGEGGTIPKELDDNKAPLKPVTYAKKAAPKSWVDSTEVVPNY